MYPLAALQVCDEQTVSVSGLDIATLGDGETMDLSPLSGNYVLAHAMASPASEVFMTWGGGTQWDFPGWAYGCSPYGCYWHYDFETPIIITGSAGHTLTVTGLTLWNTSIWGGYGYIGYFLGSTNANVLSFAYPKPAVGWNWPDAVYPIPRGGQPLDTSWAKVILGACPHQTNVALGAVGGPTLTILEA